MVCRILFLFFSLSVALCPLKPAQAQSKRLVSFSFTLSGDKRTSAGVFTKDGVLLRTLWSGVNMTSGSYTKYWDGLNDEGQPVPLAAYDIKLVSNNVTYTWEGVIGNSSFGKSQGNALQRGFLRIQSMATAGNAVYYGVGYAEGHPSQAKFNVNTPQQRIEFSRKGSTDQATLFVATDGTTVYWAGYDGYNNGNNWFIYGTNTSDNAQRQFSYGQPQKMVMGDTYSSCIDVINNSNGTITGLAVQKRGRFLFVSHKARHLVRVIDKNSGAQIQNLFFNDAAGLAVDRDDNLWVINGKTVGKFGVRSDGTLTDPQLMLSGIEAPMALAVSPDNNTLLVADGGGSQQVKAFNNQTGEALWQLGQAGGYSVDPNVTDDKFYFSDVSGSINSTFLSYNEDGSFWVGDSGNYRAQHYSGNRSFIDRIQYMQNNYSCYVDQNNPRRVFGQYLEFAIDYSQPVGTGWTLVKNWRATIPASYFENLTINHIYITHIFRDVATLSNGRTYGFLRRFTDNKWVLVELPATGPVRMTGVVFDTDNRYTYHLCADGSLKQSVANLSGTVGTVDWQNRPLTGFNANNDPVWGPAAPYATAPIASGGEPITWQGGQSRTGATTTSNVMVSFDDGKIDGEKGGGYHLGGIRVNDNKWLWKTAHATSVDYQGAYPIDGAYDVGNDVEYGGGGVSIFERSIFWNYHGEFWKNTQVNKWQHVYDNGLLVGIFGKTGLDARVEAPDGGPVPGMAGNVYYGTVIKGPDGNVYLYHGEEAGWSGIHRWRIDGLNTIQEQTINLQDLGSYGYGDDPSQSGGVDLLSGLPVRGTLADNTAGWRRNPANEFNNAYNDKWTAKTSIMSYDRFSSPDLYVNFSKEGATYTVTRDLGTSSSLSSWSLKGVITFNGTNPNNGTPEQADSGGSYFEVLDSNGKVLARIFNQVFFGETNTPVRLMANRQVMGQSEFFNPATSTGTTSDPIDISMSGGMLTVKYGNYAPVTVPSFENGGNLMSPKTVRLYFWSKGRNYERTIDIQRLRFYTGATTSVTSSAPVVSNPLADQVGAVGQSMTYTFPAGSFTDADGDNLTYSASLSSGAALPGWLAFNATGRTFSGVANASGSLTIRVTASDGRGGQVSDEFGLTVNPAAAAQQAVVSMSLMNADNLEEIKVLTSGEQINLATLPTRNISIRANTNPGTVGSVKFNLTGARNHSITESIIPYALFGDNSGRYNPWTPGTGQYTLTATPYKNSGGGGTAGTALTLNFSVINQAPGSRLGATEPQDFDGLQVKYYPNPFTESFTVQVQGQPSAKLPLLMYDSYGRVVLQRDDLAPEQIISVSSGFAPGVYMIQIGTGIESKRYKIIKAQ
ncbi:putative Ig domain-containing protein [Spirosoma fluviale]|uniref:Por secretion system C-terminal sorting domain-containing protein n=1 Tax=Spirosoma fluviale TaxID=1597977 RepID=A0A286GAD0_9BACT|nr:putative Ig domain-containing protein [Spirosoma fluviale]SOD92497.1 Por secretion system C-terminal sorting domain-containing protein [Spirosoma fluviale]